MAPRMQYAGAYSQRHRAKEMPRQVLCPWLVSWHQILKGTRRNSGQGAESAAVPPHVLAYHQSPLMCDSGAPSSLSPDRDKRVISKALLCLCSGRMCVPSSREALFFHSACLFPGIAQSLREKDLSVQERGQGLEPLGFTSTSHFSSSHLWLLLPKGSLLQDLHLTCRGGPWCFCTLNSL